MRILRSKAMGRIYVCDPAKNAECSKIACHEDCFLTTKEEYSVFDDVYFEETNEEDIDFANADKLVEYAKGFWRAIEWQNSITTNSKPLTN